MALFLAAIGLLFFSSVLSLLVPKTSRSAPWWGPGGAVAGCLVGLIPAIQVLAGGPDQSALYRWNIPYGAISLQIDALSAFFLVLIFGVSALAALYGSESLEGEQTYPFSLGGAWFFFNGLIAALAVVVTARNAILFLMAWEIMAFASFFLIIQDESSEKVRSGGFVYLIATHLGSAFLFVFFLLLGKYAGSLEFSAFQNVQLNPTVSGLLFLFAFIGFGSKAGLMPFHVWLPESYPVAPSHVTAVMSGVMSKTGIYGLILTLGILGEPAPWFGWLLVAFGAFSTVGGIAFATSQHDLKRLLAYSSVENIGIITMALGLAVLGKTLEAPWLVTMAGVALVIHILNHALCKSLLFLGAGAVLRGAGTLQMDQLGGLLKRLPVTGPTFLVGALAICALPPLNGFISEFLLYLAVLRGGVLYRDTTFLPFLLTLLALVIASGLAVVTFTRAFGITFLGEPRSLAAAHAKCPAARMRAPLLLLAAACVVIGLTAPWLGAGALTLLSRIPFFSASVLASSGAAIIGPLAWLSLVALVIVLLLALLAASRALLLHRRKVTSTGTWDCGFTAPSARMQYTGSSFVDPVRQLFRGFLQTTHQGPGVSGHFPRPSTFATETRDVLLHSFYIRILSWLDHRLSPLRKFQQGRIQVYIGTILITLVVLLIWQLGIPS